MGESTGANRFRSPPFPAMPLQRALERVEQLYRQERENPVPLSSAAKAWGMSPTSSGPIKVAGALNQYGLVTAEGYAASRKIKPSMDALRLILDKNHSSAERREALSRCFLRPTIFLELWEKWGPILPSDHTIESYLVLDRRMANQAPFSQSAAAELLANYRASMAFAEPHAADNPSRETPQEEEDMQTADEPLALSEATAPSSAQPITAQVRATLSAVPIERTVFVEETTPGNYLKVVAVGEYDEIALEALSAFVERAMRRQKQ